MTQTVETHEFQAEVRQVLSIVVESLYSNPEIFLRELISNASDAIDKLSFRALTEHGLRADGEELAIEIVPDEAAGTLTLRDNGVGMTKEELIQNLGTIARSGTREMAKALAEQKKNAEIGLIGQFGVGFYSAFLVADRVTVDSRAAGADAAWRWQSDAGGSFTVEPAERAERGTTITLHLKDDQKEYLQEWRLKSLVTKYSDYVRYPIRLQVTRKEDDEEKTELETVNKANALWTRPKGEVTDEQYEEFYKHLAHDWEAPLAWTHFRVEGTQELTGLLFVPSQSPFDMMERRQRGVRLFVKRVFIMDDAQDLLPEWLRFVRGVIDSEDLPLNVSREILQQDRATRTIRKQIVNKTLSLLQELADEGETEVAATEEGGEPTKRNRYLQFWRTFGRVLKEGIHFDPQHKDEIAKLLRYRSTWTDDRDGDDGEPTSLDAYIERMKDDQKGIYYVTATDLTTAKNSPHLEAVTRHGYEVLFFVEPIDEWVAQGLTEYEGKKLISISKGELDLPESEEDKKKREEQEKELEPLLKKVESTLSSSVSKVRLTDRLTDSPACLVGEEYGMSPHMARILRANGQDVPEPKRVLELNPSHPIVQRLQTLSEQDAADFGRWSRLILDQALLAEGSMPADPAGFAKAVAELMQKDG
jgi:molecular chaperone HtpG